MSNLRSSRRRLAIGRAARRARSMMLARQIAANSRRTKCEMCHAIPSFAGIVRLINGGYWQAVQRVMTGHEPIETLRRIAGRLA